MRVIIKIEVREITFGHAVITWNFFLIFYCCKIRSFGPIKVRFEGKKQKDVADDGILHSSSTLDKIFGPIFVIVNANFEHGRYTHHWTLNLTEFS